MRARAELATAERPGAEDWMDWEVTGLILSHVREIVILLSRNGCVRYANPAASRLLARKDPLRLKGNRLAAASAGDSIKVARAIDGACAAGLGRDEMLVLPRGDAPPLVLSVRCVDRAGEIILLVGSDLTVDASLVLSSLRHCFGLTASEAQVAAAIAAGASSGRIAADRGVRVNTIRSQIKSVAAKLGCKSQSQIGAIVRTVPLEREAQKETLSIRPPSGG